MLSYKHLIKYFGTYLFDPGFQTFLRRFFDDLTEYNITESDYIVSARAGMELGFTNNEVVYDDDENVVFDKGRPVFSHFNMYPKTDFPVMELPFGVTFQDKRTVVIEKAGLPTQTKQGHDSFLDFDFLVDNYKVGDVIITFDYEPVSGSIKLLQIRDNNMVGHLKL